MSTAAAPPPTSVVDPALEHRLHLALFDAVTQGLLRATPDGRVLAANPAAARMLGLAPEGLVGQPVAALLRGAVGEDGRRLADDEHPVLAALAGGMAVRGAVLGLDLPPRGRVWLRVDLQPLALGSEVAQVLLGLDDITDALLLRDELRREATTDFLTGTANRRSLLARLRLEHDRLLRRPGLRCSLLALDVDHFKLVNDRLGHAAGDAVLATLAQRMRHQTRPADLVARTGGEEFVLLLPDTTPEEAVVLAQRLVQALRDEPVMHRGVPIPVTVSIGVAELLPGPQGVESALSRADAALYEAKRAGRNAVRVG